MLCPAWYSLALGPQFTTLKLQICCVFVCVCVLQCRPVIVLQIQQVYELKCNRLQTQWCFISSDLFHLKIKLMHKIYHYIILNKSSFTLGPVFNAKFCRSGSKQPASGENEGLMAGGVVLRMREMIVQSDQCCGGEGLEALTWTQHM